MYKKDCNWNPATCICKDCKYLRSIIENSVVMSDEIIEATKTVYCELCA